MIFYIYIEYQFHKDYVRHTLIVYPTKWNSFEVYALKISAQESN